jgi:hypothetical protein
MYNILIMKSIIFTRGGGLRGDGGAANGSEQPPSPFSAVYLANTSGLAYLVAAPTINQSPNPLAPIVLAPVQPSSHGGFSPLHHQRSVTK